MKKVFITVVPNCWSPWEIIRPIFMPGIEERPFVLSQLTTCIRGRIKNYPARRIEYAAICFFFEGLVAKYFGMLLFTGPKELMTIGDSIVSVVIPAFNCETIIRQTIEAILQQRFSPRTHIIIVDDGSIDKTAEIVKSYPAVKYIYQKLRPAMARNRGPKKQRGIYFFTDADCVPQPEDGAMMPHFRNPEIGVVAGSYGIANPENLLANCIHAEILFRHQKLMPDFKSFGSYNFCSRKEVFLKVGGFDLVYRFRERVRIMI